MPKNTAFRIARAPFDGTAGDSGAATQPGVAEVSFRDQATVYHLSIGIAGGESLPESPHHHRLFRAAETSFWGR